MKITDIKARQVLDSRGNPTIEVDVFSGKEFGRAIVPSGASTGIYEALELRDKKKAYNGLGVLKAVENIKPISKKLNGLLCTEQQEIDKIMRDLDGTENKSKLGANAILGVSMASARLAAKMTNLPLYEYLNKLYKFQTKLTVPVPFANIINGGKHAGGNLQFQEFMVCAIKAKTFSEATQMTAEITHLLKGVIKDKYGVSAVNVGDEGGFAPPLNTPKEALDLITQAIEKAGYKKEVRIAMDAASSEFFKEKEGKYEAEKGKLITKGELIDFYLDLIKTYPIVSLEDPFEQNDFESFATLTSKAKIQIVGDDLLVTNVKRIKTAIDKKSCSALLLKVNQIGTLTESMDASRMSMNAGWKVMVSHRSGETDDAFIADLAVGLNCGQIKLGAPVRGERTAKYNQLLRIEEELAKQGSYANWK